MENQNVSEIVNTFFFYSMIFESCETEMSTTLSILFDSSLDPVISIYPLLSVSISR